MKLSIIIVSFNVKSYLRQCLYSVLASSQIDDFEVIVVDNHSFDDSCDLLKNEFPQIKLIENKGEVEKLNEKFTKEFENLATKILDENSTKFKTQNKESISAILNPLKEKIEGFEKKVTENPQVRTIRKVVDGQALIISNNLSTGILLKGINEKEFTKFKQLKKNFTLSENLRFSENHIILGEKLFNRRKTTKFI